MNKESNNSIIVQCTSVLNKLFRGEIDKSMSSIEADNLTEEESALLTVTKNLINFLEANNNYLLTISRGKLNAPQPEGFKMLGAIKELQSTLKHLIWHVNQASMGNYNHRVDFLGEFSESFNLLIFSLDEKKQIQNELIKSEERLRKAEVVSKSGSWELDLTLSKFNISDNAAQIFGFDKNTVNNPDVIAVTLPEYRNEIIESMRRLIYDNQPYDVEYEIKNVKSGELKTIRSVAEYDDNIKKVIGVVQDITEKKEAERSLYIKDAALNSALNPICIVNLSGDFIYANPAFSNTWGYKDFGEVKAVGINNLLKQPMNAFNIIIKTIKDGYCSGESSAIDKRGRKFTVIYNTAIIYGTKNKPIGIIMAFADITELKEAQTKLIKYASELEESNETKDKLFSIIAHDLKSPFVGLIGLSEILVEDFALLGEEEKKDFADKIREISKGTLSLLENLLEWARFKTGNSGFEQVLFNPYEEISETMRLLIPISLNKQITLSNNIDKDYIIYADKNMYKTVVRNLISNSIKFTKPGGEIIFTTEENSKYIKFSIKDNGVGIPPAKLSDLFSLGKKVSTKGTNDETGTGLGLIMCKEMIEKCGGQIWVESELGKGSCFNFTLKKHK